MRTNYAALAAFADKGIHFDRSLNPVFVNDSQAARMAMDVDTPVFNPPSNGVPPQYLIAYANQVIEQLLLKRAWQEIGADYQMGSFSTDSIMVPVQGISGYTSPYGDYSGSGEATVNNTFPMRDFYRGQTHAQYGELEEAQLAEAKINIVSSSQYSVAQTIAIAENKAFFYGNVDSSGVFLQKNYGLLNNPANNSYTPVAAGLQSGNVPWSEKYSQEILQDVIAAYAILQEQLGSNLTKKDRLLLCCSGIASAYLNNSNTFGGVSAIDLIKGAFPNLVEVTAPEYADNQGGSFQLIAIDKLPGGAVRNLYSYIYRAHRLIPQESAFRQKFSFGTGGCLVALPQAIANMSSIGS